MLQKICMHDTRNMMTMCFPARGPENTKGTRAREHQGRTKFLKKEYKYKQICFQQTNNIYIYILLGPP